MLLKIYNIQPIILANFVILGTERGAKIPFKKGAVALTRPTAHRCQKSICVSPSQSACITKPKSDIEKSPSPSMKKRPLNVVIRLR